MKIEHTTTRATMSWISLVGLVLVPLLMAGGLLLAANDNNPSRVRAAVVNQDKAVTIDGQIVPMGRQLSDAIVNRESDNVSWELADATNADAGLKSGEYAVVVTIPSTFSAAATSYSENEGNKAVQATVDVRVGDNVAVNDTQVAQEVSRLAVETINSTLTKAYLDNIYVGLNKSGEQFITLADGAGQLADGASKLADGVTRAGQGVNQLDSGMSALASRSPELVAGARQLAAGVEPLASGAQQLSGGAAQLDDGVAQLQSQVPSLASGVSTLATQGDRLLSGIPLYTQGTAKAVGGYAAISDGLGQVIQGLDAPTPVSDLSLLTQKTGELAKGAAGLNAGLAQASGAIQGWGSSPAAQPVVSGITDQIMAQYNCPLEGPECARNKAVVRALVQQAVVSGATANGKVASQALAPVQTGAAGLADGTQQLANRVATIQPAIEKASAQQKAALKSALSRIKSGADTATTQSRPLVTQGKALAAGAQSMQTGLAELNQGVSGLPAGVNQLRQGSSQLSSGASKLADGAAVLQRGSQEFATGVARYTDGVGSAAVGVGKLASSFSQLDDGATDLAKGMDTFRTGVKEGAEKVPSYSGNDRERLSTAVSNPVKPATDLLQSGRVAMTALLLTLALWVGALVTFTVVKPVPRSVLGSSRSSAALLLQSLAPGLLVAAGQAVGLGLLGSITLDLGIGQGLALTGWLLFIGAVFTFVNHALAAWWGSIGRLVAVALAVATAAIGLSSGVPDWLETAAAWAPAASSLQLLRTWLADGTGMPELVALAALWLAIGVVASSAAILRRRQLTVDQFRRHHA